MSALNERTEKIIDASICLRNPRLECVENCRYSKLLRLVKPLKQQWIISAIRALNGARAFMRIKQPTLLRDIIRGAMRRRIPIGGDNPNSPMTASDSPEIRTIHKWATLKMNQVSVHGTRMPNLKTSATGDL
jgi:hypothetical protein